MMENYLSVDIGGSRGRCILVSYDEKSISLCPVHSFSTAPILQDGVWCWDIYGMLNGIKQGLLAAAVAAEGAVRSVAIDCMGIAFGLLGKDGKLLCPPPYTRIAQSPQLLEEILGVVGKQELYALTGMEQQKLNTLYFLYEYNKKNPQILQDTHCVIMMSSLLGYMLTGVVGCEYTAASTSNMMDVSAKGWSHRLIELVGMKNESFPPIMQAGENVAKLLPEFVQGHSNLCSTQLVSCAAHDTASALMCLPHPGKKPAFISSGTWGMVGCLLEEPILTPEARKYGFANEGAAFGRIKFVHNTPSMSVMEACVREWKEQGQQISWPQLYEQAAALSDFGTIVDLQHPLFRTTQRVNEAIKTYCKMTAQRVPQDMAQTALTLLNSIAAGYGQAYSDMGRILGMEHERLTMVGGATQSEWFVSRVARAVGVPVSVGPAEATTLGNALAQLMAAGSINSIEQATPLVKPFFGKEYEPW